MDKEVKNAVAVPYYCRRKQSHIVMAFDLSEGHYFPNGKLLFDYYDEENNPVIKMKNGNTHTAFSDSFCIHDENGRYFIRRDIFEKTYELIEEKGCLDGACYGMYSSKRVYKQAYDLLAGHLNSEGDLLFDGYNEEGNPVIVTLESKGYVGNLDDFLMIGIEGEPYFFPREKFLFLYEFCEDVI